MSISVLDLASEQVKAVRAKPLVDQEQEKPALWERSQEIFRFAQSENRPMSEAENTRYSELTGLIEEINQRAAEAKKNDDLANRLAAVRSVPAFKSGSDEQDGQEERAAYGNVFNKFLRFGSRELDNAELKLLRSGFRSPADDSERRAQASVPGASGGYTIPTGFRNVVTETLKFYGGVDAFGHSSLSTDSGEDIQWPTNDDTSNTGRLVAENGAINSATDLSFGEKTIRAFLYTSDFVKVPITLLQDSGIDLEGYIGRKLGERLGRIRNTHLTTGDGANKPQGYVTGSSLGKSFAGATAITYAELVDLEHSVDPAYRRAGAKYMFADATLGALRKLVDSSNRPLWVPWLGAGIAGSVPSTFNGWDYVVNNDMPAMTTGNKSVLFGNGEAAYMVRDVTAMSLIRVEERFIDNGQVAFLLFARWDGLTQNSGAVKHGLQA